MHAVDRGVWLRFHAARRVCVSHARIVPAHSACAPHLRFLRFHRVRWRPRARRSVRFLTRQHAPSPLPLPNSRFRKLCVCAVCVRVHSLWCHDAPWRLVSPPPASSSVAAAAPPPAPQVHPEHSRFASIYVVVQRRCTQLRAHMMRLLSAPHATLPPLSCCVPLSLSHMRSIHVQRLHL